MKELSFELKEGLIISFNALKANKVRSLLTTLGIIIGVTSVVLMSTAVKGIDEAFQTGVSALGSDNMYITKWSWFDNDVPWWEMRNRPEVIMDEYDQYKRMAKLPLATAPSAASQQTIKFGDSKIEGVTITGVTSDYIKTTNFTFAEGRFISETESDGARMVVVIGSEIAKQLFPNGGAMNKIIKIKSNKYKIIGVLDELGSWVMGDMNPDNQVFIPLDCIFKYYQNARGSITINIRAANSQQITIVKEEAQSIMRRIRGLRYDERDNFGINQQEGLLNEIDSTIGVVQIAGYVITGLALFVGAIGIMNIMFVSVKERTKEIGIRKAIGAKSVTILRQFIMEALILCLLGGLVGLLFAVILSMIIEKMDFPVSLQYDAFVLALLISLITGILSGFAPAYSAAKMDPVEALRYE